MLSLSRRGKIGLLVAVLVVVLFSLAFVSTYSQEEINPAPPSGHRRSHVPSKQQGGGIQTREGDRKSYGRVLWESEKSSDLSVKSGNNAKGHKGRKDTHKSTNKHKKKHNKKNKKHKRPEPTASIKMAATDDDRFNAERVLDLFTSCRKTDNQIDVDCYVDAYEELCKLFKAFGTVFSFVTSDVVEKIGILRDYRKSAEADKYVTIQSLLSYEVEKKITNNKKKASGSRTLLRLHRALEFIEELLVKIKDTDNSVKFNSVATKAYDDTLAKHHPWLVKKAVHVAMYVLPSRADLLKKMNVEDSERGMVGLAKLTDELKIIFKITQDLYAKDNLLDLP